MSIYCRVHGRVIPPDAPMRKPGTGHGLRVAFEYEPENVYAQTDKGVAHVTRKAIAHVDADGMLIDTEGNKFLDLVAPGDGVEPEGPWGYRFVVRTYDEVLVDKVIHLPQGGDIDLMDVSEVEPWDGGRLVDAKGAVAEAERLAAESRQIVSDIRDDVRAGMVKGDPGRGIVSVTDADADGVATVEFDDGQTSELVLPVGPPGAPGDTSAAETLAREAVDALAQARADIAAGLTRGKTGRGILAVTDRHGDGTATVTYDDGATSSLPLPPGPAGLTILPDPDTPGLYVMAGHPPLLLGEDGLYRVGGLA